MSKQSVVTETLDFVLAELAASLPGVKFTLVARIGPPENGDLSVVSNDVSLDTLVDMLKSAQGHLDGPGAVNPMSLN